MHNPAFPAPPGDLLSQLIQITKAGVLSSAGERYRHLVDALRAADPLHIDTLLRRPAELALATGLVHALLDELDERRAAAAAEVALVLGPAAPAIVGWPE
ncbi:MAG TPA: hypothetical protein VGM79_12455 [Streptosporangiaceae bacterium]|jgi:hypothetical protein